MTAGAELSKEQQVECDVGIWAFQYEGELNTHFRERVARQYRNIPEAFHLHSVRWQVIGHFTFKFSRISPKRRRDMFDAAIGRVCKAYQVHYPKLFWALRAERGMHRDDTPHFHFLIARLAEDIDLARFSKDICAAWRKVGGGLSKVEPFVRHLNGAGYVVKSCRHDDGLKGEECVLTFSNALREYLERKLQRERGV